MTDNDCRRWWGTKHQWSKWSDPKVSTVEITFPFTGKTAEGTITTQVRKCQRCNLSETKTTEL